MVKHILDSKMYKTFTKLLFLFCPVYNPCLTRIYLHWPYSTNENPFNCYSEKKKKMSIFVVVVVIVDDLIWIMKIISEYIYHSCTLT